MDEEGGLNRTGGASAAPQPRFEQAVLLWYSTGTFLLAFAFFLAERILANASPARVHATVALRKWLDVGTWTSLYFGFSVTLVVYNKWLIAVWEGGFHFPMTMTLVHMSEKLLLSFAVVRCCRRRSEIPRITNLAWWGYACPVGVATGLDVAASNASFFYVSISLYTVVKSTSLIFVLAFSVLYGLQRCEKNLVGVTVVIVFGVILASYSDSAAFDSVGFLLVFLAGALGGFRWTVTEILMSEIGSKMNSLMTIYTISPASVAILLPFTIWLEGKALASSKFYADPGLFFLSILNVAGSGIFAFAMIYVELAVLQRTSSLSLGVLGYLKQVVQIILSVIIFHDVLSPLNIVGVCITFVGMAAYSRLKRFSAVTVENKTYSLGPAAAPTTSSAANVADAESTAGAPFSLKNSVVVHDDDDLGDEDVTSSVKNPLQAQLVSHAR